MKVHGIGLPKIGFLTHVVSLVRRKEELRNGPVEKSSKNHEFKPINPVYRSLQSPFDVRFGNTVVLQFRHDYVR